MANVLIIEASRGVRNSLCERLEYEKYIVKAVSSIEDVDEATKQFKPDVILSDHINESGFNTPFIILSNKTSMDNIVSAAKSGASDFIPKPIDMNHLLSAIKRAALLLEKEPEQEKEDELGSQRELFNQQSDNDYPHIVGVSPGIVRVKELVNRAAASDARVLITGDNGTGKELVARMLHHKSRRSSSPFVEINCAAIPSELIESELFGHEKGSFTSALKQRKGKFEQASGGTLFMDEIGDMSLSAQAKVLRALQEGRISRVGSDRDVSVDVRVVAATNKNLRAEIDKGTFREDLYHRLSVIIIHIPPLCERTDDIPLLVEHFAENICKGYGIVRKSISAESIDELCKMPWRGNVRELRNVMERLIILGGDRISIDDVRAYVSEFV
jgi:DNA-binding NtrC family response regulator